ncbi:bifunctional tRNA (5-methylaminomethyl-2-thiouridine)(34)-methyltransferase MnmD/FAD-dependent 5-carboxymethylaminomethyl-2-thiouridine(34) oxidoreductase MnmC [Mergibacter septicus]|uniref:bifunctional tRNA (5-methylaminomethyl-2-thiouridine)(34)-methyltransferase MnmD/FAD-dependent 5-carboxymethylaminomethyl-2-thiouridine(34) oxidoreductase MnmC n=1 Tax=Mergibacter septicus TaxID=221402 RepID=UPI0011798334|nr:bifunctional tRNA (5-methylaminomethyl-2-thiouridine)(34)-methyltransferase MnmD/FAD-dependent 5-carboxymethylaminomethyl-2-thiouridine(34) oxidoreductase MnmC [Mergibacter septicus]AWX13930.1 bifunctional tRNA (5-methylaminomethyl-2-thiouridine)(34)-methyltransferase MnmD/FAD-dependent 5-carboxymethylaminomethyl-2-thiouridine(34) oxidoreductase MnmC [Mergibacter septicus]
MKKKSLTVIKPANLTFNEKNIPISTLFDDVYFCQQNGLEESYYVFFVGNDLWQRWQQCQQSHFVIAETGFGTGLNFLLIAEQFKRFRQHYPNATLQQLFFISFEKYPLTPEDLAKAHQAYPQFSVLSEKLVQQLDQPISGCQRVIFDHLYLDLWFGDIQENLPQLGDYMHNKIDAWLLDGFAPSKNPAMWQESLYQQMYRYTRPDGTFATFTAASSVRKGLLQAGFEVKKRKGYGKKRECLHGYKDQQKNNSDTTYTVPWYLAKPANFSHSPADIAIIGGGIASLCTAASLLQRGAKVTLYCKDAKTALNASGNKQGAFYPQLSDDDLHICQFYAQAFIFGQHYYRQLAQQGVEFEHQWCGVTLCGYNLKAQQKLDKIAALGLPPTIFARYSAQQLSKLAGLPLACDGGFIPNGAWLNPRQLVQNFFTTLQKQGLILKTETQIVELQQQEEDWLLRDQQQNTYSHRCVILANGHLLTQFKQTENLPLYPVRGQVSQIPTTPQLSQLRTVLCYDGYLTPVDLAKQSHCIGASHIRDNSNTDFSPLEQQQNQQKIQQNLNPDGTIQWVKEVDTSANLARMGVRSSARDRAPLIGNVADIEQQYLDYHNLYNLRRRRQTIPIAKSFPNLFLIGGLGSRGLTSAPLLGETLASLIFNHPLPLGEDILHTLSPNRNWIRKLLKGMAIKDLKQTKTPSEN